MRLTSAQRARLRELCDEHSAMNMPAANIEALLDQIDEQEAELALLRPLARAAQLAQAAATEQTNGATHAAG